MLQVWRICHVCWRLCDGAGRMRGAVREGSIVVIYLRGERLQAVKRTLGRH